MNPDVQSTLIYVMLSCHIQDPELHLLVLWKIKPAIFSIIIAHPANSDLFSRYFYSILLGILTYHINAVGKYVHELLLKGTGENCSLVILHVIIMLLLVLLFKLSRLILMLIVMLQDHTRVYT